MRIRRNSTIASCVLIVMALVALAGCRAFVPESVRVNKAPETYIIGAPPEDAGGYYRFHVYWYGRDEDGRVERYVWALTDTTIQDPDTTDDEEDQRFNPASDASTLAIGHWTTKTDSVFNFTIGQGVDISTHKTLHVVAMDDFGDFDRTPARLHFFTNTLGSPNLRFFHVQGTDTIAVATGQVDTVGFGQPYEVIWRGSTPNVRGYSPAALALIDTVAPTSDGLFGYKWKLNGALGGNCQPSLTDCWHPRKFDEATGDSFSYFGSTTSLTFSNDGGSVTNPFRVLLPSGSVSLEVNSIDVAGVEVAQYQRPFSFIVNYDPQTVMLNGEQDWAHPSDPETYPYYIELNDPAQVHHPFQAGDRIPDRTYVVVKALARDDARDLRQRPSYTIGLSGYLQGLRTNYSGGLFPFTSEASALDTLPAWDQGVGLWYGDTLGFLTAPNSQFTINMQAVDEHGRRDGSPASLSFDVGYAPCLQCLELLPRPSSQTSGFDETVPCVESTASEYLETHPCLAGVTQLRVSGGGVPNPATDLETVPGAAFILINRDTGFVTNKLTTPTRADSLGNYVLPANRYRMGLLIHGKDDAREAWAEPERRLGAVQYEVAYGCDPFNEIKDGGGNDDVNVPTWGMPSETATSLVISPSTGLWKVEIEVYVPSMLALLGEVGFKAVLRGTINDPAAEALIWEKVIRQFGDGWVEAIALDQTAEGVFPVRPACFNFFRSVRPAEARPADMTWRDCGLSQLAVRLPLSQGAMSSLSGDPVRKHFRLVLHPASGGPDVVCEGR